MKSKLKKKTKVNQIIFPHQFRNQEVDNHIISESQKLHLQYSELRNKLKIQEQSNRMRFYSKESSLCLLNKIPGRSFSHKSCITNSRVNHPRKKRSLFNKHKAQIIQTKNKISTITDQFSQVLYKKMNQNLLQECEKALKQKTPFRSLSVCKMEKVSPNLFYIKKIQPQHLTIQTQFGNFQGNGTQIKPVSIQQISKPELQVVKLSQIQKQAYSHLQIRYSQEDLQQKNVSNDIAILKKKSLFVGRDTQILLQPLISSQSRNCKLIDLISSSNIFMVSSKMLLKSSGFFKILKINFISTEHCYLQAFLQYRGETVYKKIYFNYEKRNLDAPSRRNHLKKIHQLKNKLKQKIFMHFSKVSSQKEVIPFFQDLLSFIEQYLHLQRTYLGLVFTNYEDLSFALVTQQKFQKLIKVKNYYFFLVKLKGTYYLVKADFRDEFQLKFTLVIDFTTLSSGDQLNFEFHSSVGRHSLTRDKIHKFLPQISEDFVLNTSKECESSNKQRGFETCSTKIAKVMIKNMQKWGETQGFEFWDTLWDINNMYSLVSQQKLFFIYHSQFDYGFFKTLRYQRIQGFNYNLSAECDLSLYKYPRCYQQIKLSQIKMQALVIAHLPVCHEKVKKCVVLSFFCKKDIERKKQKEKTFQMVVKNFKVHLKASKKLQIYFQCLKNYRRYKLVVPNENKILSVNFLTKKIFGLLKDYRINLGLIYSKLSKYRDNIVVLYKGLHKFQMQFVYVTLYKISAVNLVEFRVHAFKMNRNFIVRIQNFQFSQEQLNNNVNKLLTYFGTIYFQTLLQQQSLKSKKRRKDALQDFLKNQIRANPNNLRPKRKNEEEKRRLMRLASIKCSLEGNNIYEDIISRVFKTSKGQLIYLTLRNLPVSQIELLKVPDHQIIELQLYIEGKIAHFKYQLPFKEIMSVMRGKNKHQICSLKEMYLVLKQVAEKIQQILKKPFQTMDFVFANIKTFIDPTCSRKIESLHPFKFIIIGNNFFQTKHANHKERKIDTRLSIDFNLFKPSSFDSNFVQGSQLLNEFQKDMSVDFIQNASSEICKTVFMYVKQKWVVRVIDIIRQQSKWPLLARQKCFQRQIKLMNRDSNQSYILCEWEGQFLGELMFQQFNKRMLKRTISAIKMAL